MNKMAKNVTRTHKDHCFSLVYPNKAIKEQQTLLSQHKPTQLPHYVNCNMILCSVYNPLHLINKYTCTPNKKRFAVTSGHNR